jgi:dihydroorotate dehydrogenase
MAERRIFEDWVRPQIVDRFFDPETAHDLSWRLAHSAAKVPGVIEAVAGKPVDDQRLHITLGRHLAESVQIRAMNPLFEGAGVHKSCKYGLEALQQAGVGGAIVGAVTKEPQPGNDKPRLFRVDGGKVVNSFGFNSPGMGKVRENIWQYENLAIPIIINVGLNKNTSLEDAPQEYGEVVDFMYFAADGFEICTSSPNTTSLRELLKGEYPRRVAFTVRNAQEKNGLLLPTAIKASPDMDEESAYGLVKVAHEFGFSISSSNTSTQPQFFSCFREYFPTDADIKGGASGDIPKYRYLTDRWQEFYYREGGPDLEYWGGGGVNTADHAWRKIGLGADMVYIVAGVAQKGLGIFNQINRGLVEKMDSGPTKSCPISHYRGSQTIYTAA